jgi:hypothetical protein
VASPYITEPAGATAEAAEEEAPSLPHPTATTEAVSRAVSVRRIRGIIIPIGGGGQNFRVV